MLRGLVLGLSGGVDEIHTCPTASRCSFRYLGNSPSEVRKHYPDAPRSEEEIEDYLAEHIIQYIDEAELASISPEMSAHLQIPFLNNTVSPDHIPFVLRGDR